jgi:cbb3-type cytochrome oxidase cytochrome c subunit
MPVPTDTLWNIRRLNRVFAVSAVLLMGVLGWATLQDYNKPWREPQRQERVWEAALVNEKISRDLPAKAQEEAAGLRQRIGEKQGQIEKNDEEYRRLVAEINQLQSRQSDSEFRLNNQKAELGVMEGALQDAITAGDEKRAEDVRRRVEKPRADVKERTEEVFRLKTDLAERKKALAQRTDELDGMKKDLALLTGDAEALEKKLALLVPQSGWAKVSMMVRQTPLMQFINPAERVKQVVLADVQTDMSFGMKIPTIDRCTTCHVNVAKKDFTRENVLDYLEEQVAAARDYNLPEKSSGKATEPAGTQLHPGATALPAFWVGWGNSLVPNLAKNRFRVSTLAGQVGKSVTVTWEGKAVPAFKYDAAATGEAAKQQDALLLGLIEAWSRFRKPASADAPAVVYEAGPVRVEISGKVADATAAQNRTAALQYSEVVRDSLRDALPAEQWRLLLDRYRYALVDAVNPVRKRQGLAALDPSAVMLAHPDLGLYVDMDSKHPLEKVGCTSCHDGSGQETDFVLAAHTPRKIWVDEKTGEPVLGVQVAARAEAGGHGEGRTLASMLEAVYPQDAVTAAGVGALHRWTKGEHGEGHAVAAATQGVPATQGASAEQTAKTQSGAMEVREDAPPAGYVDPATGKRARAVAQMAYWKKAYEPLAPRNFELVYHEWDRPMLAPEYLQANCVRCHTGANDIREHAPVVYEGRQLFGEMGCVNCHQMDSIPAEEQRKVGTDLRHVTSKLSPAFINTWVWAPKAFRPTTKMPHFFMLENNSSDEEIRRTRQEARAITEYLVQTATPLPPKYAVPADGKGDKGAGQKLFNSLGCLSCHQNLNERGEEWIVADLQKRAGMKAAEAKQAYAGMTYNERQLYAQRWFAPPTDTAALPVYADKSARPVFVHTGPELSGIGTKLTAGRTPEQARAWLFDWLKDPRHYSAYTIMPRLRLTDAEALNLVEYLLDQKRTNTDPKDAWAAGLAEVDAAKLRELVAFFLRSRYSEQVAFDRAGDEKELTQLAKDALVNSQTPVVAAEAKAGKLTVPQKQMVFLGQKLIAHYGCMSCHAINGTEALSSPCANLSDWGQKSVDKLAFEYVDPHKVHDLPHATDVQLVNGLSADAAKLAHVLPGEGWTGRISETVAVGWPEVHHNRTSWITQKLKNTRVYDRGKNLQEPKRAGVKDGVPVVADPGKPYDKLRMPTFYLDDAQVDAIVTFVISNRDRLVTERMLVETNTARAKQIAHGRYLTEKYNCVGCHQTEANQPFVQQYYPSGEVTTKAPPSLRGEGNKVQHAWLFNFLRNVEPLRPLPVIRMPSFPVTDEESTAIAAYFAAVSNKEADELRKRLDPVVKYVEAQQKGVEKTAKTQASTKAAAATKPAAAAVAGGVATKPAAAAAAAVAKAAEVAPGEDWFLRPEFAQSVEALKRWGLAYRQIKPTELDASRNSAVELAHSYRTLLFRARFTEGLYEAPYPFVESPRPDISAERFKLGEEMLYAAQCLKCHVMGDPRAPGARQDPTAPNLDLAQRRLQRRWVRHWVQEPPVIQVGTAMPAFFTGEPVNKLEGQSWPRAQNIGEPQRSEIEKKFGATVEEQTDLLLDFVYAAGVRGYTAVQPAAAAAPAAGSASGPATRGAATGSASGPTTKRVSSTQPGTRAVER